MQCLLFIGNLWASVTGVGIFALGAKFSCKGNSAIRILDKSAEFWYTDSDPDG